MNNCLVLQGHPAGQHRYIPRTNRHQHHNYYNRTKRKRDNSSETGHDMMGHHHTLPPWCDPAYPYSRGMIG